jgi:hypothetical protein
MLEPKRKILVIPRFSVLNKRQNHVIEYSA